MAWPRKRRALTSLSCSAMAAFSSASEKNCRLRRGARIQRSATCTPTSAAALSLGRYGLAGRIATAYVRAHSR